MYLPDLENAIVRQVALKQLTHERTQIELARESLLAIEAHEDEVQRIIRKINVILQEIENLGQEKDGKERAKRGIETHGKLYKLLPTIKELSKEPLPAPICEELNYLCGKLAKAIDSFLEIVFDVKGGSTSSALNGVTFVSEAAVVRAAQDLQSWFDDPPD